MSQSDTAPAVRIGVCFGTYPPERNGGADFIERFSNALAAEGARVAVITSTDIDASNDETPGVTVHRVVSDWRVNRGGLKSIRAVRRIFEDERIEILHAFFPDSVLQGRYQLPALIGFGRVPLVTTFWNLGLGRRSPAALRMQALALLARSRVLSSHDPAYIAVLRRLAARRPVRWIPVGNNIGGAPAAVREELRRQLSPDVTYLGYFGQLDETRGIEELIAALASLRRTRDVRLLMIGSAGRPQRYAAEPLAAAALARYRALPAKYGVEEAVEWTSYLADTDVAGLLAAVDVVVLPYRRISLGRSALAAALEAGTPVVLGGTPATAAPLEDERHVLLFPPGDSEALAKAIGDLIDDPDRHQQLVRGAAAAARLFAWPRIAAAALDAYEIALRRPG